MYVASNPQGARSLEIDREVQGLQERLERGVGADPIVFRPYPRMAIGDLTDAIRRFQPDVLHFAAHGENDALVLAYGESGYVELDASKLSALLKALSVKPRLVVINACSSDGMAAGLAAEGAADFVIGTDAPITNDAARDMATALYQRLADAASIADAFSVAATNFALVSGGSVSATLHPLGLTDAARTIRLVDPLRIVACLPMIDDWLDAGLVDPDRKFRPEQPEVLFGLAGAPAAARQTVFFTDDESVKAKGGSSLEEARSWIIETQPVKGEIWMSTSYKYYGDMTWYAAVTTTDRRVASAAGTTVEALRRYYFEECWKGDLPARIAQIVERSINSLVLNDGSRRGRNADRRGARQQIG